LKSDHLDDIYEVPGFAGYFDIGQPSCVCVYCGALMWIEERVKKSSKSSPKFHYAVVKEILKLCHTDLCLNVCTAYITRMTEKANSF
jgi:hypothetical protein